MKQKNFISTYFFSKINYKELIVNIIFYCLLIILGLFIGFLIWSENSPINNLSQKSRDSKVQIIKTNESIKWKKYRNSFAGYELEIPNYFKHASYKQENSDIVTPTDYWYTGELNANGKECHTTGESIIIAQTSAKSYKNVFEQKPDKTIKVGGISTSQYKFNDWIAIEPIEHNQTVYKISYVPPCDKPAGYKFPQRLDDFNRMINSITFIDESTQQ